MTFGASTFLTDRGIAPAAPGRAVEDRGPGTRPHATATAVRHCRGLRQCRG
ncbi:hypothetical protein AB0C96_14270 [Streptomyces sp. NPDC048506]|uniref:hypothetical protein n=1 Tax=Streptomyces sp. NPDC048506 TaxID=3155028 RepID=UPI0034122E79